MSEIERYIKEHLSYEEATGKVRWIKRTSNRVKENQEAGHLASNGYLNLQINNINFGVHRIAWFLHYNKFPPNFIDHINGIRSDNRISNLREATLSENNRNLPGHIDSNSRFKGVCWHKAAKKWRASIYHEGKQLHIGLFLDERDAALAYNKAAEAYHGEFCKLNEV